MTKLVPFLIFLISSSSPAADFEVVDSRSSSMGVVELRRISREDDYSPPQYIYVNNSLVFDAAKSSHPNDWYVRILGMYELNGKVILLISQSCGGTGCRVDPLSFVVVDSGPVAHVVTDPSFASESNTATVLEEQGGLKVELGYEAQKRKSAKLYGDRLTIVMEDATAVSLDHSQCEVLYEAFGACIETGARKLDCNHFYGTADFAAGGFTGSNADTWNVRGVAQHPGYDDAGFRRVCISACGSRIRPSFDEFESQACGGVLSSRGHR